MTGLPARHHVTEAEFLALPESMERIELVDGEVILSPSPSSFHQDLVRTLLRRLEDWADAHRPAYVGLSPLDVRIGPERIVQPDLFVIAGGLSSRDMPIRDVPDLAIEVLSSRATYDRLAKRLLYAEAGVREYWLVDPLDRLVEQVVGLQTVGIERERLVSRALPGLEIDLVALFAELG